MQVAFPTEENFLWIQSYRVLLSPLTYIHVGEDQVRICHLVRNTGLGRFSSAPAKQRAGGSHQLALRCKP